MQRKGNNGVTGKKGRSGRKSKAEELGLRALLDKCWTEKDREDCLKKLAEDAKSTEAKLRIEAAKLLLSYAYGKPTEHHEISQDSFDFNNADLSVLNDYELGRITAGDEPRSVFAAASARRIREKAKAG